MAVKLSKMVTDRLRWFQTVASRLEIHGPEVAEALTAELRPGLEDGEEMPDELTRMRLLMRRLERALNRMVTADGRYTEERARGAARRRRRDDLTRQLQQAILDLRDMLRIVYSRFKAQELGFERRVMHRAHPLMRQADRILGHLRDPELDLPPTTYRGTEVTPTVLAGEIEPLLEGLRAVIDEITREEALTGGKLVEKQLSIKEFDGLALLVMDDLAASFRLAGKAELARDFRVLPRRSRASAGAKNDDEKPAVPPTSELSGSTPEDHA